MIPVSRPLLEGNEKAYLADCIDSGWISSEGPYVCKFEEAVARYIGRRHAISVSSGTTALELALSSLELKAGDEVILPSFTIISCVTAVIRAGAKPVLVDCDPVTFNMNVLEVASKVTDRTRAILVVHIYGLPCDMDALEKIANDKNLIIIEDAAEMLGQTYRGKKCGSFGRLSILSFYANKIITTGEGGMVLTDDSALAEKLSSSKNLCFNSERRFVHENLGWNYRMTNLQAAIGLAQMEQLNTFIVRKREIGILYNKLLEGVSGLQLPLSSASYAENIYWVYPIVVKSGNAEELADKLVQKGVMTRPFFWPLHEQPALHKRGLFLNETYPHSESIARKGLYLPSGLGTTNDQITAVCKALLDILG